MLELHNFEWEGQRLVQVETPPHHIAGVLASIQETLAISDCEWDDIYSAYYKYEEDETITFYESEIVDAGNPEIWTYSRTKSIMNRFRLAPRFPRGVGGGIILGLRSLPI